MFLSQHASRVYLLCRGTDLTRSMSEYLLTRVKHTPNIDTCLRTEVTQIHGSETLESVTIANRSTGEFRELRVCALFIMIGADPCTTWLRGTVRLDGKGFIRTGATLPASGESPDTGNGTALWPYQTDIPGVFAVGDVRSGSVKRVASAVGGSPSRSPAPCEVARTQLTISSNRSEPMRSSGRSQGDKLTG
jgi:thioredoxin reductase (NADPH)